MTGVIDLDGQRAIVEQNDGDLAIYSKTDIEEKADGTYGPADGAEPEGALELEDLKARRVGTESDPVPEAYVESSHAQELSVSDSTAVTGGPVGDETEFLPLDSGKIVYDGRTTNTSYSDFMPNGPRVIFNLDHYDLTNISTLYASASLALSQDTSGETVSFVLMDRASRLTTTEVTEPSGFPRTSTPIAELNTQNGLIYMKYDLKVSGGTGGAFNDPVVTIWGEIQ